MISRKDGTAKSIKEINERLDAYDEFCRIDIDLKNNKAVLTEKHIKEVYERCLEENDFL